MNLQRLLVLATMLLSCYGAHCEVPGDLFQLGVNAYRAGDFSGAAGIFRAAAENRPSSGTLQNLGSSEWQTGRTGPAVLAWEQALWVDPFNKTARMNLRYARRVEQVESPQLAWFEVISTWLPANWWAPITGMSLWLAIGITFIPGVLRQRKAVWQQGLSAFLLMIFLLTLPALLGVRTRGKIGFVVEKKVPLRLTPTAEAQQITQMRSGDPARFERVRNDYVMVQTSRGRGWLKAGELGLTCPRQGAERSQAGGTADRH